MVRFSQKRFLARQQRIAERQRPSLQPRLCLEELENRLVPSTLHVGSGPGEYHTIQAAVDAAHSNDTIRVDPGTYTEQVTISNSGHARNNLKLEGSGAGSTFIVSPSASNLSGRHAIVEVENAQNAKIEDFTIEGPSGGAASNGFYGIRVDNGSATIVDNHITKIEDTPFNGIQEGVAILVGRTADGTTGSAIISNNLIDDYQKGGIVVDNTGSSAAIENNKIVGAGPTAVNAQNGIQISRGATADVSYNKVSGNEYTPGTAAATGILLVQSGAVRVDHNTLTHNDFGVYDYQTNANVVIDHNRISQNTTNGILLALTTGTTIEDNRISHNGSGNPGDGGIALYESTGNTVAYNRVDNNHGDGIFVDPGSTGNTFDRNQLKHNSNYDAEDQSVGTGTAGTGNTWTHNQGKTSSPPGLVSQERGRD